MKNIWPLRDLEKGPSDNAANYLCVPLISAKAR